MLDHLRQKTGNQKTACREDVHGAHRRNASALLLGRVPSSLNGRCSNYFGNSRSILIGKPIFLRSSLRDRCAEMFVDRERMFFGRHGRHRIFCKNLMIAVFVGEPGGALDADIRRRCRREPSWSYHAAGTPDRVPCRRTRPTGVS